MAARSRTTTYGRRSSRATSLSRSVRAHHTPVVLASHSLSDTTHKTSLRSPRGRRRAVARLLQPVGASARRDRRAAAPRRDRAARPAVPHAPRDAAAARRGAAARQHVRAGHAARAAGLLVQDDGVRAVAARRAKALGIGLPREARAPASEPHLRGSCHGRRRADLRPPPRRAQADPGGRLARAALRAARRGARPRAA